MTTALAAAAFAVAVASLTVDSGYSVPEVLRALFSTDPGPADFVVNTLRLPRLALGILVGLGLRARRRAVPVGAAQPAGQPGRHRHHPGRQRRRAVAMLLGAGVTGPPVSLAAARRAALAVAALLYAVAWRGGMAGHRFVLAGIGVAYVCAAVVGYLLTRAEVQQAQTALLWLSGSLAQTTWPLVRLLAVALAVLVPLVVLVGRGARPAAARRRAGREPRAAHRSWCGCAVIGLGIGARLRRPPRPPARWRSSPWSPRRSPGGCSATARLGLLPSRAGGRRRWWSGPTWSPSTCCPPASRCPSASSPG